MNWRGHWKHFFEPGRCHNLCLPYKVTGDRKLVEVEVHIAKAQTLTHQVHWSCVTSCSKQVCVLSRFSHVQLFATLCTIACPLPLSMGFSQQGYWSGLLCPVTLIKLIINSVFIKVLLYTRPCVRCREYSLW